MKTPWWVGLAALMSSTVASATDGDLRRFALVLGSNDGGEERVQLRYAGTDAEAFASVMTDVGGIAPVDVQLLLEPGARDVTRALGDLAERAHRAQRQGHRVEVLIYYSGHSDVNGLLPSGQLVPYSQIRDAVQDLNAEVRVSILDSCASGALIRSKGGVMRSPFLSDASMDVEGEAFLTSSTADEASQESDTIGASFFTHHLVTGLRGAADADEDGLVTLGEVYSYTFRETRRSTEHTRIGPQHPNYAIDLAGQGDFVMTDLRQADSVLVLDSRLDGLLWIEGEDGRLLAEVDKVVGSEVSLSVPSGAYQVLLQSRPDAWVASVRVREGAPTLLVGSDFEPVDGLVDATPRGGLPPDNLPAVTVAPPEPIPEPDAVLPVGIQVVPTVGLGGPTKRLDGFAFDILGGSYHSINGAQMTLGVGIAKHGVNGAQMGLIGVSSGGPVEGLQMGTLYTVANDSLQGMQLTGGVALQRGGSPDIDGGSQIGLVGTYSTGSGMGAQLGGLFNVQRRHRRHHGAVHLLQVWFPAPLHHGPCGLRRLQAERVYPGVGYRRPRAVGPLCL